LELLNRLKCPVQFLSGTLMPVHQSIIEQSMGNTIRVDIDGDNRKIDEILIIVTKNKLDYTTKRMGSEINASEVNHLWFVGTKNEAKLVYGNCKVKSRGYFTGSYNMKHKLESGDIKLLITYPRSAIARAANMPGYDVVSIDTQCHDPRDAVVTMDRRAEVLAERITENLITLIAQAAGRVLRVGPRDKDKIVRKVIVLHNTDILTPIDAIKDRIQKRVGNPIEVVELHQSPTIIQAATVFIQSGESTVKDAPQIEKLSKSQGSCFKKLTSMRQNGSSWGDAARGAHVNRAFSDKEHRAILKKLFKTDCRICKAGINRSLAGI
jgi:hypothetical protein